MKILKTLGIVAAFHAAAYFLFFVTPGCRSTPERPVPADTGRAPAAPPVAGNPGASETVPSADAPDLAPAAVVRVPAWATVRYSPTRPSSPAAAMLQSAPPPHVIPATTYTVVANDNLTKIAKKHGLTVADLARANRLANNSMLQIGQKLIIPAKSPEGASPSGPTGGETGIVYIVQPNDTLGAIARQAGVAVADLKRLNNLASDYLRVGQELQLPPASAMKPADAGAAGEPAPAVAAEKSNGGLVHVVKFGESLSDIAKKYQVKVSEIALANNIGDPNKIRQGQKLVIPGPSAASSGASLELPEAAAPAIAPDQAAPPAANQDLDTGLKEGEVPVIKVEDSEAPRVP